MSSQPEETSEVWGYAASSEAETWGGSCATREEAIAEGRGEHDGGVFWICKGERPDPGTYMPSAANIIDIAASNAYELAPTAPEDWPKVSKEAVEELDALLTAWARKHCRVEFWEAAGEPERVEAVEETEEPTR